MAVRRRVIGLSFLLKGRNDFYSDQITLPLLKSFGVKDSSANDGPMETIPTTAGFSVSKTVLEEWCVCWRVSLCVPQNLCKRSVITQVTIHAYAFLPNEITSGTTALLGIILMELTKDKSQQGQRLLF